MSTIAGTVFGVLYLILSVFIVAINSLLIASLVATKQSLKKTSNFLIVFLSIVDCVKGAAAMPLLGIVMFITDSTTANLSEFATKALMPSLGSISIDLTMLIACDRYVHMNPDLNRQSRLQKLFKKPGFYILVFSTVILDIPLTSAEYFWGEGNPVVRDSFVISFSLLIFAVMSFLFVIYVRGYRRIRQFVAENPVYSNRGSTQEPEYVRELYKTVLMLLIAMLISYLPACLLLVTSVVLRYTNPGAFASDEFNIIAETSLILYHLNSFTNALIIIYRNNKSKTWLARKIFGFWCKLGTDTAIQNNAVVICNMHHSYIRN